MLLRKHTVGLFLLLLLQAVFAPAQNTDSVITGAEQVTEYVPLILKKKIAVVANQTSIVGKTHLVDVLLSINMNVIKIFTPEHGFRGDADAGEKFDNSVDVLSGLPIISLYGLHKKPTRDDLKDIDIVIFDLQDVGTRFYTYIGTLQYVMEACAENKKQLIILDRPNPNGYYVDGPVLDKKFSSFVGMNPIPVVHGLTVGEYAQMLNGEKWLSGGLTCDVKIIKVKNYTHKTLYKLPIKPSPNLPNMSAVYLYPSLCFFEGTVVSLGRGTELPFQVIGYPGFTEGPYSFTPKSIKGMAVKPLYENVKCNGFDLREFGDNYIPTLKQLYLFWMKNIFDNYQDKNKFFNDFFDKLAGTDQLRKQIISGTSEDDIRKSWQPDLKKYKQMRKKYLLYEDFE